MYEEKRNCLGLGIGSVMLRCKLTYFVHFLNFI